MFDAWRVLLLLRDVFHVRLAVDAAFLPVALPRVDRAAEVEGVVGWLEVGRCSAAAASADGVHILGYQVDTGLKAPQASCREIACCCILKDG